MNQTERSMVWIHTDTLLACSRVRDGFWVRMVTVDARSHTSPPQRGCRHCSMLRLDCSNNDVCCRYMCTPHIGQRCMIYAVTYCHIVHIESCVCCRILSCRLQNPIYLVTFCHILPRILYL